MSQSSEHTRVVQRRDTEANWQLANPELADGELVVTTDSEGSLDLKLGKAINAGGSAQPARYSELPRLLYGPGAVANPNVLRGDAGNSVRSITGTATGEDAVALGYKVQALTRGAFAEGAYTVAGVPDGDTNNAGSTYVNLYLSIYPGLPQRKYLYLNGTATGDEITQGYVGTPFEPGVVVSLALPDPYDNWNVSDSFELTVASTSLVDDGQGGVVRRVDFEENIPADFQYAGEEYTIEELISYSYLEVEVSLEGTYAAHAEGLRTTAEGEASHAEGVDTRATRLGAHAEGSGTQAAGEYSHAEGYNTSALGSACHTEGSSNIAQGNFSHVEGVMTQTIGVGSHTEGSGTFTAARYSHAEGSGARTSTIAEAAHAEGFNTWAQNKYSHVEGDTTVTNGLAAHAEGIRTAANGEGAHAEGQYTNASGAAAHSEGLLTSAGNYGHAEGKQTTANGETAHAEGLLTTASGASSHAEGNATNASGVNSHSEGHLGSAGGEASHAEGIRTSANGAGAHAEGNGTVASGAYSHAEGDSNTVSSTASSISGSQNSDTGGLNNRVAGRQNTVTASQNSDVAGVSNVVSQSFSAFVRGQGHNVAGGSNHTVLGFQNQILTVFGATNGFFIHGTAITGVAGEYSVGFGKGLNLGGKYNFSHGDTHLQSAGGYSAAFGNTHQITGGFANHMIGQGNRALPGTTFSSATGINARLLRGGEAVRGLGGTNMGLPAGSLQTVQASLNGALCIAQGVSSYDLSNSDDPHFSSGSINSAAANKIAEYKNAFSGRAPFWIPRGMVGYYKARIVVTLQATSATAAAQGLAAHERLAVFECSYCMVGPNNGAAFSWQLYSPLTRIDPNAGKFDPAIELFTNQATRPGTNMNSIGFETPTGTTAGFAYGVGFKATQDARFTAATDIAFISCSIEGNEAAVGAL